MRFEGQIISGNERTRGIVPSHEVATMLRSLHVGELGGKRVVLGHSSPRARKEGSRSQSHRQGMVVTTLGRSHAVPNSGVILDAPEAVHDVDQRFARGRIGLATWDANALLIPRHRQYDDPDGR